MKVSEITIEQLAEYLRVEYGELDANELALLKTMQAAAVAFVRSYTGQDDEYLDEHDELVIAVFVMVRNDPIVGLWDGHEQSRIGWVGEMQNAQLLYAVEFFRDGTGFLYDDWGNRPAHQFTWRRVGSGRLELIGEVWIFQDNTRRGFALVTYNVTRETLVIYTGNDVALSFNRLPGHPLPPLPEWRGESTLAPLPSTTQ
jgi:hypothetical protein